MQFGEFGYRTRRRNHHTVKGMNAPIITKCVLLTSFYPFVGCTASRTGLSSSLRGNITSRESPWRGALHCCCLACPVGAPWTRSELSCRLRPPQVPSLWCVSPVPAIPCQTPATPSAQGSPGHSSQHEHPFLPFPIFSSPSFLFPPYFFLQRIYDHATF